MVSCMRSWSKLMGLSFIRKPSGIRKPPGSSVSAVGVDAPGAACWARTVVMLIAALMVMMATASTAVVSGLQGKSAELWLGGDVNLGDGERGQLQGIAGIGQRAAGSGNLEGPGAARSPPRTQTLQLGNAPQ